MLLEVRDHVALQHPGDGVRAADGMPTDPSSVIVRHLAHPLRDPGAIGGQPGEQLPQRHRPIPSDDPDPDGIGSDPPEVHGSVVGAVQDIAELVGLMKFIFLERPGFPVRAHPEIPGLRLHRCDGHLLAINSTELRERTRCGLSLDYFVPHKAIVYIKEMGLYRTNA